MWRAVLADGTNGASSWGCKHLASKSFLGWHKWWETLTVTQILTSLWCADPLTAGLGFAVVTASLRQLPGQRGTSWPCPIPSSPRSSPAPQHNLFCGGRASSPQPATERQWKTILGHLKLTWSSTFSVFTYKPWPGPAQSSDPQGWLHGRHCALAPHLHGSIRVWSRRHLAGCTLHVSQCLSAALKSKTAALDFTSIFARGELGLWEVLVVFWQPQLC